MRSNTSVDSAKKMDYTEEFLLSDQQRDRFMKEFQSVPIYDFGMPENEHATRLAAVLICLCVDKETKEVSILYTKRASTLKRHSGQIAFPGGLRDPEDTSFSACALREAHEEVGLCPERVEVWGEGSLFTPPKTNTIMPVVGVVRDFQLKDLVLNPAEVDEAFSVPIKKFFEPDVMCFKTMPGPITSPCFDVGLHQIWGVTGYLTFIFLRAFVPPELGNFDRTFRLRKSKM